MNKKTIIVLAAAEAFVHIFTVTLFLILILIKGNNCLIKNKNYFEYQKNNECAGYASAYVLRSLGIEASGSDIYNEIENKDSLGLVYPTDVPRIFEDRNLHVELCYNLKLDALKKDLNDGVPIIVFVKTNTTSNYNHYITLVGYNKDKLFFFDSLKSEANVDYSEHYNRTITNEDFIKMWNVDETYKNIYIKVENK